MPSPGVSNWLKHPLAEALLRFSMLPSTFMHPARQVAAGTSLNLPALHRHRSAELIKLHDLDPVLELDDPALPLALLPDDHFNRMALLLGAALNAPHIRRTIARDDVAQLRSQIGEEGLGMARGSSATALAGMPVVPDWEAARARLLCILCGTAVFGQVFDGAAPPVSVRANLRIDPQADGMRVALSAAGLTPPRALEVARDLLATLEPEWLSSFATAP